MKRSGKNVGILVCVIFFTAVNLLFAAVPRLINYPGKLTDSSGNPLTGTYSIAFSFYDVEVAGSALWTETQSVAVNKGVFNVLLGSVTALNLDFSQQYWLEMKVGGETLSPRQKVSSVAYSIRSVYADYANQVSTPMVYIGHGDIDTNVSEKCFIHLDRVPASVKLFIIGEKLSTLFYTELGAHNHTPTESHTHIVNSHTHNINHTHIAQLHTHSVNPSSHGHGFKVISSGSTYFGDMRDATAWKTTFDNTQYTQIEPTTLSLDSTAGIIEAWNSETGPAGSTTNAAGPFSSSTTGVSADVGISSAQKTYNDRVQVYIDGQNKTGNILGLCNLPELGTGVVGHSFVTSGTGVMDITSLVTWSTGQHIIEFKQEVPGGGRVRYNIYITY